ncbi:NlpC/P60 family protein [Priestia taiwanensis]|uniref:N-acetylmuramoyl-L-alanine amidase n=1 Tax=Priestia taiwanensis TaxID=1347902 RepID=A0A917AYQ2_9BACI|nr:C40 family peptidase [Priestia taiwanensis]MBM7364919.1 peptidoglycan hydrolase CwlO-like protein [Priestia taiwanensis]GGE82556.1 N-acetylmuramoyl-L-alanine amidase [Priestia taiwanensis]
MKGKRIICSSILAGVMMFSSFAPVAKADNEKEQLQQQINLQKEEANAITKEMNDLKTEVEAVDKDIKENQSTLATTQKDIEVTEADIQKKLKEIEELEKQIEARTDILKKRVSALQTGDKTDLVVDVLLNSENIADMFSRLDSLTLIFQSDEEIMKQLDRDQKKVEEEKALVEAKKNDLVKYEELLQAKKQELEDNKKKKNDVLATLQAKLEKIVNEMESSTNQLDQLNMEEQLQRQALFVQSSQEDVENEAPVNKQPTQQPTTPPASGGVIGKAMAQLGKPYIWGSAGPRGFDCSGFISYVYGVGRTNVVGYWGQVQKISSPQPGDLVFFQNTYKKGPSHIGVYIGNNQMVHAGDKGIAVSNLSSSYNKKHFLGYGRF